eukprot:CAMPEP_0206601204 /NCGR_PEP_ID=MMETSP0325_2-20121206/46446_1 /ASSEMBLY_ACC=CAM_ASM_000347 /TAXON_ID=2866 /ORGANISM="Crypthecodinium cohnii, Strain Seligo" /LENGTH=284 /DNA_ID=CAMNT_0054113043 /DNA_START=26 /DNA_END=880 /DNA_ORIENTATION=+
MSRSSMGRASLVMAAWLAQLTISTASGSAATAGDGFTTFKMLEWNVYWQNKNAWAIASTIMANNPAPDIIGLCELTVTMQEMAEALRGTSGRDFLAQPGRDVWQGYGTDIFYDNARWEALEGGAIRAGCSSWGGPRASNWVVLKERNSGQILITGGTHLSYCPGGCDQLQQCELRSLYSQFDAMKGKYPGSKVAWMGDMNQGMAEPMLLGALEGDLGGYRSFPVDEVVQANANTYMYGGPAIDHIFAERGSFQMKEHGLTGQGVTGQYLNGADHFPVYTVLTFG